MSSQAMIERKGQGINWVTTSFLVIFHAGAVGAFFMFTWQALAVAVALYFISGMGIGMGYHRLLTHRGYRTPKAIEYLLTLCATLALEGGPIFWVATHRIHHTHSDREGDPHSPRDGFWWAHIGWIIMGESMHHNATLLARYAPDLAKDRFHVWLTRLHWVPQIICALLLLAAGGWPFVMWGVFFRVILGLHATWLVNSATHLWGTRRFKTRDDSRNNWWVALVSFGEGWHNNHHAHPTSARHGLAWYEVDLNWYGIRALELLGLARNVRLVKLTDPVPEPEPAIAPAPVQSAA
jgi:stearoyl-CoA desaturase (delta-9 desaturase)